MTTKTLHNVGDTVEVCCTTTDQRWCRNTVTVTHVVHMPCGCRELACDRPGPIPQPHGLLLIDRADTCRYHTGWDEDPRSCRCLRANVDLFGHCLGCPVNP